MTTYWLRLFFTVTILSLVLGTAIPASTAVAAPDAGVILPTQPIPYALDYATNQYQDAWDMSEFSDISQYLNGAGRHVSLANPAVANGLFSATTLGDHNGNLGFFYMVFPDYPTMSRTGKLGKLNPIKTSQYSCIYLSMKVNSRKWPLDAFFDGFKVMWYANDSTAPYGASPNGGTKPITMHYDYNYDDPYPIRLWKLFKVDLNNPPEGTDGKGWDDAAEWQGLEINPSMFKDVSFEVDWIKLTNNCSAETPYQAPIRFTPSTTVNSIWLNPSGTTRNIRVAIDVIGTSGNYTLDTKGLAAGKYKVGFGDRVNCCSQWSTTELTINTPPNVNILKPSATSGQEYSASAGNAWDMDATDIKTVECAEATYSAEMLNLTTQYPTILPTRCRGGSLGEADPKLVLNSPVAVPPNSGYRYLSFRMYQNGPWQYVADGMMVRWMWVTPDLCTFVGNDIPLDVGWHTYTIDLYDPINGTPVQVTSPCSQLTPWKNAPTISYFRLDPNENYTGIVSGVPAMVFNQQIDWIKLTKVEQVKAGSPYTVQLQINKSLPTSAVTVYYTSDPTLPKQHTATAWTQSVNDATRPYKSFVPVLVSAQTFADSSSLNYKWNTTGIAPGEYYICTEVNDSINKVVTCSAAPVAVTN